MSIAGLKAKLGILLAMVEDQAPASEAIALYDIPSTLALCRDMEHRSIKADSDEGKLAWYRRELVSMKQRSKG
jgi:hypothetical protein